MGISKKTFGKKAVCAVAALVMTGAMIANGLPFTTAYAGNGSEQNAPGKYYADYKTLEEERAAASELNIKLEEESIVLLKNKDNILPLASTISKISMFSSVNYNVTSDAKHEGQTNRVPKDGLMYGGTGSGQGVGTFKSMNQEFADANFKINPTLKSIYESVDNGQIVSGTIGGSMTSRAEVSVKNIETDEVKTSVNEYNDAYIATISRHAGEGQNLWTKNVPTHEDPEEHYLQLDKNELDLLKYLKEQKKETGAPIIYLINTANPLELAVLEDDPDIDAIVWIGYPGTSGLTAVPKVLKGEVNPSGRLVDTYAADFKNDPTWFNHNPEGLTDAERSEKYPLGTDEEYSARTNLNENVYVDYRWYETAAATKKDGKTVLESISVYDAAKATIPVDKNSDPFYNRSTGVVYPFGYGLSYTTFEQKIKTTGEALANDINNAKDIDDKVTVEVEVKNTGKVAGKSVAQLYVSAPYTKGEIEKPERVLVSFAKTKQLAPNETQTLKLEVRLGDIASFDDYDRNNNKWNGWEIEAGSYKFQLMENSHVVIEEIVASLNAKTDELYTALKDENGKIKLDVLNPFSQTDGPYAKWNCFGAMLYAKDNKIISRADLVETFPEYPSYIIKDAKKFNEIYDISRYTSQPYTEFDDKEDDLWYVTVDDIPAGWTQATEHKADYSDVSVKLKDMSGIDYKGKTPLTASDTKIPAFIGKTGEEAWDLFMNQLTYEEMAKFISDCGFHLNGIDSIGKELTIENDGPAQLNYNAINVTRTAEKSKFGGTWSGGGIAGWFWCSEVNIASTWNVDLAYEQGRMIGNDGLFSSVTAWYGPGVQVHRSPFVGRNFEYYSGDGLQGGFIAAAVIGGAQSKGLTCYMKHFGFLAPNTGGEVVTEQALREVHLKAYEYAVKFGNCQGIMTVTDMCGAAGTSNYVLNVSLACDEWGFKGVTITDWYGTYCGYANFNQRNGVLIPLNNYGGANHIGGQWNETAVREYSDGSKVVGMLMENEKYNTETQELETVEPVQAPNTWYYTRMAAMRVLWVAANGSANYNGLDKSAVVDKTLTFVLGESYVKVNAGLDADAKAKFGTDTVRYQIKKGTLPAGLTFDEETGTISGKPTETADVSLTIAALGDNYYAVQYTLKLYIPVKFRVTENNTLEYSTDGENWNAFSNKSVVEIKKTATEGLVDTYTVYYSDGTTSTFTVTNGKDGVNGKDGLNGKDGVNGKDGLNGKDGTNGKDGVNGKDGEVSYTPAVVSGVASGVVGAIAAVIIAMFVTKKKIQG